MGTYDGTTPTGGLPEGERKRRENGECLYVFFSEGTVSKFKASDDDIKAFMVAIFPDGAELAMAAFDERYVLQEAARLIQALRQDVGALEHGNAQLQNQVADLTAMAGNLHAANLKRIECQKLLAHSSAQDIRKTHELNVLVKENRALLAKVETFAETERLAVENANRAWAEVDRLDIALFRIGELPRTWLAWQERIQADYWKDQGVVSILEKPIHQLGEMLTRARRPV
jgi:hypothetical protein